MVITKVFWAMLGSRSGITQGAAVSSQTSGLHNQVSEVLTSPPLFSTQLTGRPPS
jgi:hypothetical protein